MQAFNTAFTAICHINKVELFESKWTQLIVDYPTAGKYLHDNIYVNKEKWCSAWTDKHVTFGAHSTQRVEVMNNYIKMFDINNSKQLIQLFQQLKQAISDQAKRSCDRRAKQVRTVPSHAQTLCQQMEQHLTIFAAQFINHQYGFIENYSHQIHSAAPNCVVVTNKIKSPDVAIMRGVVVTPTSMHCDCYIPVNYLLPCRHVLYANKLLLGKVFLLQQINKRWYHSYMPPPLSAITVIHHQSTMSASAAPDVYIPRTDKDMSKEEIK
jgi:hypothetical protein